MALSRQAVIESALNLADRDGLDALTLRALAARLGVRAPTLYWHVRNKVELLDAISDAIMDDALAAVGAIAPSADWRHWLLDAAVRLRRVMLAHSDSARIISGARSSLRRADFSELAMTSLVSHGVDLRRARLFVLAVERFTVGYVLEEQSARTTDDARAPTPDELTRRLPNATRAITEYFETGRTADDLFADGVRLILGAQERA